MSPALTDPENPADNIPRFGVIGASLTQDTCSTSFFPPWCADFAVRPDRLRTSGPFDFGQDSLTEGALSPLSPHQMRLSSVPPIVGPRIHLSELKMATLDHYGLLSDSRQWFL